jgi:small conductance mechanosensitive channel
MSGEDCPGQRPPLGPTEAKKSDLVSRMMKTVPLKQSEVGKELRKRIKKRFDEEGIDIPYSHRVPVEGEKGKQK